jgi:hypothetical protein
MNLVVANMTRFDVQGLQHFLDMAEQVRNILMRVDKTSVT